MRFTTRAAAMGSIIPLAIAMACSPAMAEADDDVSVEEGREAITVTGVRQDFKPGSPQTWAAFGVQGMPLFGLETEATAFLGEGGQTALRLEAEYDILLSQRWVLQPTAELNLHGRNDEARGVASGLSDASVGLRLRYEISRQFAPYVGVSWGRAYGNTADLLRADDEDVSEAKLVAGIRFWF